jgi:hypothetical protein
LWQTRSTVADFDIHSAHRVSPLESPTAGQGRPLREKSPHCPTEPAIGLAEGETRWAPRPMNRRRSRHRNEQDIIMLGFAALGTFAIGEADRAGLAPFIEWLTRWRRRGRR